VPREAIDFAVEVAGESPSACNRQPFEFLVYDDPELVQKIASIPKGCSTFSHNFPCVVLIVGKQNAFSHERDRHVVYVDASLAAMSFQYALTAQGIGSCCINWPALGPQDAQARKLIKLEKYEQPILLISVGYPEPERLVPISVKKPVEELRSYNRTA
jgi:nitroreductase